MTTPGSPRSRRLLWIALGALALAVVAAVALFRPAAGWLIRNRASAAGVTLDFDDLHLSLSELNLSSARFSLRGAPEIQGRAVSIVVRLSGLTPSEVELRGAEIGLTGAPFDLGAHLARWRSSYGDGAALPLRASNMSLRWNETVGAPSTLALEQISLTPAPRGGTLRAGKVTLARSALGAFALRWVDRGTDLLVGLGEGDPAAAQVQAVLPSGASPPSVHLQASSLSAAEIGAATGERVPATHALLDAVADLAFPEAGGLEGKAEVKLRGYVPPHPRELDGVLFGSDTVVTAQIERGSSLTHLQLHPLSVAVGAVKLDGGGTFDLSEAGLLKARVAGSVPCSVVARSAAMTDLGKLIGGVVGDLAKVAVSGSVDVTVAIEADSRNLGAAKIVPSVGVGCGLRGF